MLFDQFIPMPLKMFVINEGVPQLDLKKKKKFEVLQVGGYKADIQTQEVQVQHLYAWWQHRISPQAELGTFCLKMCFSSFASQFFKLHPSTQALSWWHSDKEPACQCRRVGFHPWVRKIPWRRQWKPTPVFLPGESHGQRSQAGYSQWGGKELNMTEQLTLSLSPTIYY